MEQFDAIIFIGPQGSGKGTQATILRDALGAEYVEMGGLLRKVAKEDTDFGRHIKELTTSGALVNDKELMQVLEVRLHALKPNSTVILDGVPRVMRQAEILLEFLREHGIKSIATFYITLPRAVTIKRLQRRLVCTVCEHPEIANGQPNQKCAVCGGSLMHRADDTEQAINRRLDNFEIETLPVVGFLKRETKLMRIDGSVSIPQVTAQIFSCLGVDAPELVLEESHE